MAVPSRDLGDFLLADWANSVLLFPEVNEPSFSLEGIYHVNVQTFFIVGFPLWVVRVCFSFDFYVSLDWHVGCLDEIVFPTFHFSIEDPVVSFNGFEVFLRNPFIRFLWVSSFHPLS